MFFVCLINLEYVHVFYKTDGRRKIRLKNQNRKKMLRKSRGSNSKIHLFTCQESILVPSLQSPLQRSRLFLIILVKKMKLFIPSNSNLF